MVGYFFKDYDNVLEKIRKYLISAIDLKNKNNQNSIKNHDLDNEIEKHQKSLIEQTDIVKKVQIYKNIIYLKLKKLLKNSENGYIKKAIEIFYDKTEDSAYEALDYLNRAPKTLETKMLNQIHIAKALFYEYIEDFDSASYEYKKAIKYDKTPNTLRVFKDFIERVQKFRSWQESGDKKIIYSDLHNKVSLQDMPNTAQSLEKLAKYYANSPKSREIGKKYFKEVLKMYKKLSLHNPKEYKCKYIETILDAVEIFMMSPILLKEAKLLLNDNKNLCKETKLYLIERLKELKSKNFIKQTFDI